MLTVVSIGENHAFNKLLSACSKSDERSDARALALVGLICEFKFICTMPDLHASVTHCA